LWTPSCIWTSTSRYIPIIRTCASFVAGLGNMSYARFAFFNVTGGVLWVTSLAYAGFLLGNMPWVKSNPSVIVIGIIILSMLPAVFEVLRQRLGSAATPSKGRQVLVSTGTWT
jgi:membrane-associated protein